MRYPDKIILMVGGSLCNFNLLILLFVADYIVIFLNIQNLKYSQVKQTGSEGFAYKLCTFHLSAIAI